MSSMGRPSLSPARYRKGTPFSEASTQGLWGRVGCVGDISARPPALGKRVRSHSMFGKQSKSLSGAGAGMHVCPPRVLPGNPAPAMRDSSWPWP